MLAAWKLLFFGDGVSERSTGSTTSSSSRGESIGEIVVEEVGDVAGVLGGVGNPSFTGFATPSNRGRIGSNGIGVGGPDIRSKPIGVQYPTNFSVIVVVGALILQTRTV